MAQKLMRWIMFSVSIALMPIVFNVIKCASRNVDSNILSLISNGDLLLISTAITAAAIGEIVVKGANNGNQKIIAVGVCVIIIMFSSLWFADISRDSNLPETYSISNVNINILKNKNVPDDVIDKALNMSKDPVTIDKFQNNLMKLIVNKGSELFNPFEVFRMYLSILGNH